MSPGARNSRIFALENMLATSSSTLVLMASQLSEAEERERVFSGKGCWNQVRSLPEAKNVMNHLFNLASSSRCLLRDKEVDCREKDSVIRELKEKIVTLTSLVRQLEAQKEELLHKEKLRKLMSKKHSMEDTTKSSLQAPNTGEEDCVYDLRKGPRNSSIFNVGRNSIELLDMDTSDSDPETCKVNEEDDEEWVASDLETDLESERLIRKRSSRTRVSGVVASSKADSSNLKSEVVIEDTSCNNTKPVSNVCCSCSKKSFCKTGKCECRSNGATCGTSCGCAANKCTNRKDVSEETDMDASVKSKMSEGVVNTDDTEMTRVLASQGAMLLQSALDEKLTDVKSDGNGIRRRKPLSDIGNTQTKSNAPRPNPRKKWKKSQIQIIPVPPPSTESESMETSIETEKDVMENNVPLKLPRAMRSATSSNSTLKDKNSDRADEVVGKKTEGSVASPENPIRQASGSDKENHGI